MPSQLATIVVALLVPAAALAQSGPLEIRQRQALRPIANDSRGGSTLALSPDGQSVACTEGHAFAWDVKSGRRLGVITPPKGERVIGMAAFRDDNKTLITDGPETVLRVWDIATGKLLEEWKGLGIGANALAVHGTLLAIACSNPMNAGLPGTVRLVDTTTGKEKSVLRGHKAMVSTISFSGDGKLLVSGSQDNTARLWNVATAKQKAIFTGHANAVNSVAISPDGKTIATASYDKTVKLWDVANTKKPRLTLRKDKGAAAALTFSPDGKLLAGVCQLGGFELTTEVILWDTTTGKQLASVDEKSDGHYGAIVFSRDGRIMVTATFGLQGQVVSWDLFESGKMR